MMETNDEQLAMLAQGEQPTIVKFWSPKCSACKMIAPAFKELAAQAKGIWFLDAQVEELPIAAAALKIEALPTLVLFREGREVDRLIGVPAYQRLIDFVSQAIP